MVAKKNRSQLSRIKKNIENAYNYWEKNAKRFNYNYKFLCISNLDTDDKNVLDVLERPNIQTNVLKAYVSRQLGEFSRVRPSFTVHPAEGSNVPTEVLDILNGHFRYIEQQGVASGKAVRIYKDMLVGSYSSSEVGTQYDNPNTFNQSVYSKRSYDPTLVFFDPLANTPHKGDGEFSVKTYPKRKDEVKSKWPHADVENVKYIRKESGLNWSYESQREKILLVAEYYEKTKKKVKKVLLANGEVIMKDEYEAYIQKFSGEEIEQAPAIVRERDVEEITIDQYIMLGDQILEYKKTKRRYLPSINYDNDSVKVKQDGEGAVREVTRSYFEDAKGAQRLLNFAVQTQANELENMVQHKFIVAKPSIPTEYADAYTNVQVPNIIMWEPFLNGDPAVPLPAPREVMRPPIPPEIGATIKFSLELIQNTLGSYDASQGISRNQLSGAAIEAGALQSSATNLPSITSYIQSKTQEGKVILDLIKLTYVDSRDIPVIDKKGKQTFQKINQKGGVQFDLSKFEFDLEVEVGSSYELQQNKSLSTIIDLSKSLPIFAEFVATEPEVLTYLIDNVNIRNKQEIKDAADSFTEKLKKKQANSGNQPNPEVMKQMNEAKSLQLREKGLQLEEQRLAHDTASGVAKHQQQSQKNAVEAHGQNVDLAIKAADMSHRHIKETHETFLKHKAAQDASRGKREE